MATKQRILIDGYNLIFECGWKSDSSHPSSLRQSRQRLLHEIAKLLTLAERKSTTVVFDSKRKSLAKAGQDEIVNDIEVLYSIGFDDADSMLEDMIRQSSIPKRLIVVSSDHRIQRAATARQATAIDSNDWIEEMQQREASRIPQQPTPAPEKPTAQSESEREMWLKQFQMDQSIEEIQSEGQASSAEDENFDNPFPPGYGEDLLE